MSEAAERQLVIFDLANEHYGVPIHMVREIIRMQVVTHVPDTPPYVEGVINLRGRVIPVVDLRCRFGFSAAERDADTRVLVVDIAGDEIGAIVDAVREVKRVPEDSIEPAAAITTTTESYYIDGIAKLDDRLLILLDLERALEAASADAPAGAVAV